MSKKFKLTGLEVVEGTICDQPMNPEAKVVLFKRRPAQQEAEMPKTKTQKNAPGEDQNTDPLKALKLTEEQEKAVRQMLAEKAATEGEEEESAEEEEEAEKAADPVDDEQVGKAVSKADRELAELRKQLAEERSARLDREYLEKARAFPAIPVPAEKIGGLMRAVSTLEKSHGDTLGQVLRACNELASTNSQITKSLGKANGLDGGGGSSAAEEIESIAAKAMAANPDLSKADAIAKAWKDNPKLVLKSREEAASRR